MDARVRVLKTVNGLPNPPALSEKAREHLVRSSYILKNSQNLDQAEKEVASALNTDPWWLEGYYNIGILQAKLNRFVISEENLAIYIAAAPPAPGPKPAGRPGQDLRDPAGQGGGRQDQRGYRPMEGRLGRELQRRHRRRQLEDRFRQRADVFPHP